MAIEDGCGDGKKSRTRTLVESESECQVREEDRKKELLEEKKCFTKHCTNEFYKINNIKVQVLEAEYPGTFWVEISCHKIYFFWCRLI